MENYGLKTTELKNLFAKYYEVGKKYNILYNRVKLYQLFVISATKKKLHETSLVYRYLSKGTIQYYRDTIKRILGQIDSGTLAPEIEYFNKYHYLLIHQMEKLCDHFMKYNDQDLSINDKIDVSRCTGTVRKQFMLFNSFKDILESYKVSCQYPVSVFARINDWDTGKEDSGKKDENVVFTINDVGGDKVTVSLDKCKARVSNIHDKDMSKFPSLGKNNEVKFTNVFDSNTFPKNDNISMFMGLSSQLAMGKGTTLITYGYSGVGKTVTLFGSNKNNPTFKTEGLLQSTLAKMDKEDIYFRAYELYGMAFQYKFYWNQDELYQRIYTYGFQADEEDGLLKIDQNQIKEKTGGDEMTEYIDQVNNFGSDRDISSYIKIDSKQLNDFSNITEEIDNVRKGDGRIKCTRNNVQSSRSIVIYDFIIKGKKEDGEIFYTPFVIIDLPGKEDINGSFINDCRFRFYKETGADAKKRKIENNAISSSLFLNPIMAMVLEDFGVELVDYVSTTQKTKKTYKQFKDTHEVLSYVTKSGSTDPGRYNKSTRKNYDGFKLKLEAASDEIIKKENATKQKNFRKKLEAIELMKYLVENNKFEIIIDFLYKVVNEKKDKLYNSGTKRKVNLKFEDFCEDDQGPVQRYTNKTVTSELPRSYIQAPYEGIYINENINGLLKYLISQVDPSKDIIKKQKDKYQDMIEDGEISDTVHKGESYKDVFARSDFTGTGLDILSYDARTELRKLLEKTETEKKVYKNIYKINKESYRDNNVYRYENPLMEKILKPYLGKLKNYYLFYLLSNNNTQLKCAKQINLLENSLEFIKALDQN